MERITRPVPFSVRLSKAEETALKAVAVHEKRPVPDMVRELIRRKAVSYGVWPCEPVESVVE